MSEGRPASSAMPVKMERVRKLAMNVERFIMCRHLDPVRNFATRYAPVERAL